MYDLSETSSTTVSSSAGSVGSNSGRDDDFCRSVLSSLALSKPNTSSYDGTLSSTSLSSSLISPLISSFISSDKASITEIAGGFISSTL